MTQHRWIVRGVAAAAVWLSFAGSALAATEIVVWHAYRGDEKSAFEKVIGMFNASQAKITVRTLARAITSRKRLASSPPSRRERHSRASHESSGGRRNSPGA